MTRIAQLSGPSQEGSGRADVASFACPFARGRESRSRAMSQPRSSVRTPQLLPVAERRLQVVGDDLLQLGEPRTGNVLEPVGQALMQFRPRLV